MKIGILIDRLNMGGVEKIALEEVRALRQLEEDAYLLILRKNGSNFNAFKELQKQVPIIYLDDRLLEPFKYSFQFPIFHFFSFFHLSYPLLIPFVINKNEFDYLIVHGTYTSLSAITIKLIKGIPFSAFIWDPITYILKRVYSNNFHPKFLALLTHAAGFIDKLIISSADEILTGGNAHNEIFNKLNPDKKITCIPPGAHSSNQKQRKRINYVLMVTAWKRGKNPEYIFKLLERLPDLHIKIAGKWIDPKYAAEFKKELRHQGYADRVQITGEVTEKQLNIYYEEAAFLLQTNDDRGFGMPALEAAAHKTTFIIPQGQGVCQLFTDKLDCYFTSEHDTDQIVKYISALLNNGKKVNQMGNNAYLKVKKKYLWSCHAKRIKELIQNRVILRA